LAGLQRSFRDKMSELPFDAQHHHSFSDGVFLNDNLALYLWHGPP
jgi:hypothetical protein